MEDFDFFCCMCGKPIHKVEELGLAYHPYDGYLIAKCRECHPKKRWSRKSSYTKINKKGEIQIPEVV